jgi:tetratricopeptide (TPR) repeat protein
MTRFTPSKTKSEAEGLVRQWIDACLWRQEAQLAETDGFAFLEPDEIKDMDRQDAIELDGLMRFSDRMFAGEQKAKIARALGPGSPGFDAFDGIVNAVGRAIDVPVDRETADGRFYARMIMRGHATLLDEMRENIAGIPKQVQASVDRPILPNFPFFTHWDEFVATKKSDRKWKRDTADGAEATPRLFKALIGELPLAKIDGSVVGRFRLEYLKLPFDHFHAKKWNKLTTKQVLAAVQKLDEAAKAKIRLTSTTTANKHVLNPYQWTREGNVEALRLFKIAISLDPLFARAYALASNTFSQKKAFGWIVDAAKERVEGRQMAERAIQLGKDDPLVLTLVGWEYSFLLEEPEKGLGFLARAMALDPNLAIARTWAGWSQIYLGNIDAGIKQFSEAIRLSPIDPRLYLPQGGMAHPHFFAGRYDESLSWATSAIQRQPNYLSAQRMVVASLAMTGRIAEARRAYDVALQADPSFCISGIKDRMPLQRFEDIEKLAQAYRLAGVPE